MYWNDAKSKSISHLIKGKETEYCKCCYYLMHSLLIAMLVILHYLLLLPFLTAILIDLKFCHHQLGKV